MFIAVVMKNCLNNQHTVSRPGAVTHPTREGAIKSALSLREAWINDSHTHAAYRIFVGELTTEVIEPVRYEEVPITL